MELVDGGTLKDLIASGPLPTRKLLELGTQIADGLAAAHAAGIVHRDLKPANVMVTKHGFAKILDFGLAKLITPEDQEVSALQTAAGDPTRPGLVMGTVGYMSPEQASGRPVDFRSDQFSFGSILYEMATGKRAFERGTTAETLTAIIREEPASVAQLNPRVPAPIRWLVERCLSKDREDRFGTTKDLARDLASVRDHLSEAFVTGETTGQVVAAATPKRRLGLWPALAAAALAAAVGIAAFVAGKKAGRVPPPTFRELTFQRGEIYSARFAPDGQTILYAASWEGRPVEIFVSRPRQPGGAPLRPQGRRRLRGVALRGDGRLAQPSLSRAVHAQRHAGADRRHRRRHAARGPGGRAVGGLGPGRTVAGGRPRRRDATPGSSTRSARCSYESEGWFTNPRVSPDGGAVAFMNHPLIADDGGYGRRGRSRGQAHEAGRRLLDGGRPGLVARRPRGLVHGRGDRRQSLALRRRACGPRENPGARHREPDAAGRLARRPARCSRTTRCAPASWPGLRATRRSATSRGSTGRRSATSRRTARSSCSARRGRVAGPTIPRTRGNWTVRRRFASATEIRTRSLRTENGPSRCRATRASAGCS